MWSTLAKMPALSKLTVRNVIIHDSGLASPNSTPLVSNVRELHLTNVDCNRGLYVVDAFLNSFTTLDGIHLSGVYKGVPRTSPLVALLPKVSQQLTSFGVGFCYHDPERNPRFLGAMRAILEIVFPKVNTLTFTLFVNLELVHRFTILFTQQAQLSCLRTLIIKANATGLDVSAFRSLFNASGCRSLCSIHVGVVVSKKLTEWTGLQRPIDQ